MKIYLDIDGTMIHESIETAGKPANGLKEFIEALKPHDTYWLTTHCMEGDPQYAQAIMKSVLPEELHSEIDRVKPTKWQVKKTEAIDFNSEFIWFDNDVMASEREELKQKALKDRQWLVEVHLEENPNRLLDIVNEYF